MAAATCSTSIDRFRFLSSFESGLVRRDQTRVRGAIERHISELLKAAPKAARAPFRSREQKMNERGAGTALASIARL